MQALVVSMRLKIAKRVSCRASYAQRWSSVPVDDYVRAGPRLNYPLQCILVFWCESDVLHDTRLLHLQSQKDK